MEKYIDELLTEINQQIRELEKSEKDYAKFSKLAFEICEIQKLKLREFLSTYTFKDDEEEILFFKKMKPKIEVKSIFYCYIFNIESKSPSQSRKGKIAYYKKQIAKICNYYKVKKDYFNYYKTDNSLLDQYYFLRKNINIQTFSKFVGLDSMFSTGHDLIFNTIAANEEFNRYLEQRVFELESEPAPKELRPDYNLNWTANKVDLVELMYALYASKSVNNGDIDMSKLADAFQRFFNIELGDFYRIYTEIKIRNNKVKFSEKLINALENKIDNEM